METSPEIQPQTPALQHALSLLGPFVIESSAPAPHRLDILIVAGDLPAAAAALVDARWGYLAAITGVDLGPEAGIIELLYHFVDGADVVWLRSHTPRDNPEAPTVCGVIPSASFYERELSEMLGVAVRGAPDPRPLFLPEEWPQGVYPLRKDFDAAGIAALQAGAKEDSQ